jgi:DNA-directed RNA polymerase subunit K
MSKDNSNKYERARVIGARALQLSMGAPILIKMQKADFERLKYNPITIAKEEYRAGVLPLKIRKKAPENLA